MREVQTPAHGGRGHVPAVVWCVVLSLLVLLAAPAVALADVWTDISDAQWVSVYKVTADDAFDVAQGYPDRTFRPAVPVSRGQFAKMAMLGLGVPTLNPLGARFPDVPRGSTFYEYVEGASAAGIIGGYTNGRFGPDDNLLRQQAYSILGKYLSAFEIQAFGHIDGDDGTYANLTQWYAAEGLGYLAGYADAALVDPVHRPATAYLIYRQVVLGSQSGSSWYLSPQATLNRAPAVAMILRTTREVAVFGLPAVSSLAPASGPVAGGTTVTIQGHGFVGVSQVSFGTIPATSFTVNSGTSITAVSPATSAAHTVAVSVANRFGTSENTAADNFMYLTAPAITLLDPATGPGSGGNQVTIQGVSFVDVTRVMFGDATVTAYVVDSSTAITATAPPHVAGDVTVQVTAGGGTSSAALPAARYTYGPAPALSAVAPNAGAVAGGNQVTITGSHLTGATRVDFGAQVAQILTTADGTITALVPSQQVAAGLPRDESVAVTVVTPMGAATLPAAYMYLLPPTLDVVQPAVGPMVGVQSVVITGYHLFHVSAVTFGGVPATVVSATADGRSLAVTRPPHAEGAVDVIVATAGGTATLAGAYRYVTLPTIISLSPDGAPAGLAVDVTINGTNFVGVSSVRFGTTDCTVATVNTGTLRVTVPALAGGVLPVTVRAAGGDVTMPNAFTFTYTLAGVVRAAGSDATLAGATVSVYQQDHTTLVESGLTAANGSYAFELAPGTYTVKAQASGHVEQWYMLRSAAGEADLVVLTGDRPNMDFSLALPTT